MSRTITYNNITAASLGVEIKEADYGDLDLQSHFDVLTYRNGYINSSRAGGQIFLEPVEISYTLILREATPDLLSDKIRAVRNWVYSVGDGYLYDGYFADWRFTNVQCRRISTPDYLNDAKTHALLTVHFICDPYMESTDGVREQIITLAGKNVAVYILTNSVLCTGYVYPESPQMQATINDTDITLTFEIDSSYAGLRCFDVSGNVDVALTGGDIAGEPVTLAGNHNGYMTVPAAGGTLTLTGTVPSGTSSAYITIALAAGISFAHDASKKYRIDDYAVGTHDLYVNGTSKPFDGFTVGGIYDTISIVGARQTDVYKLWYDSVEVSL